MRCPDCEKFVSYDTEQEPEDQEEPSLDENGHFHATYRRVLACAECGTELKETVVEVAGDLQTDETCKDGEHSWDLAACSASATSGRGWYGVLCAVEATCSKCGAKIADAELDGEVAAGAFDPLI